MIFKTVTMLGSRDSSPEHLQRHFQDFQVFSLVLYFNAKLIKRHFWWQLTKLTFCSLKYCQSQESFTDLIDVYIETS